MPRNGWLRTHYTMVGIRLAYVTVNIILYYDMHRDVYCWPLTNFGKSVSVGLMKKNASESHCLRRRRFQSLLLEI
jgi:hypothetical protein